MQRRKLEFDTQQSQRTPVARPPTSPWDLYAAHNDMTRSHHTKYPSPFQFNPSYWVNDTSARGQYLALGSAPNLACCQVCEKCASRYLNFEGLTVCEMSDGADQSKSHLLIPVELNLTGFVAELPTIDEIYDAGLSVDERESILTTGYEVMRQHL